ncbi:MAG: hypothetical protein VXY47_04885 [Bacteroidota bacterium]|nr:hypothetical protein [Bacteroidota bacterium]
MFRIFLVILMFFHVKSYFTQHPGSIEDYIPYEYSSYSTHPILTLKTILHIVYRTKDDPNNIMANNHRFIDQQFTWINNSYKNLKQPTLLPDNKKVHYIPDARIRFRLDTIIIHYDSVAWNRIYYGVAMNGSFPLPIDSINIELNTVVVSGNWTNTLNSRSDSLSIGGSRKNNGIYHPLSIKCENNRTYIVLEEPLKSSESSGYLTYFKKIDKNCWRDNWEKLAGSDSNAIHIFYTGATSTQPAFGCGPSPYFLNLSKLNLNGDYASASLTAHELGHCLGLRHTNYPQFNDLPERDKFGFIPCDSIAVSNNIMGYNKCRNYLSPKQIGFIHQNYSNDESLIQTTANGEYDPTKSIKIKLNTTWNKAILISGDLIIKPRKTLVVKNVVSMAENSTIFLCRKAKLVVDGTLVTNNHNKKWKVIVLCKSFLKKDKKPSKKINFGQVIFKNGGALKNNLRKITDQFQR